MKFVDNSEIQACWEFGSDSREPLEILVVFFFMCFLHPLTQLPSTKRGVLLVLSISTTHTQFVTRDNSTNGPFMMPFLGSVLLLTLSSHHSRTLV